ncbi:MAG: universal stress protein [Pseudomonadales bacterium]
MHILIASDLTARSDRAIPRAYMLASQLKGSLTVAHVMDAELPDDFRRHSAEWAERALRAELERCRTGNRVKTTVAIRTGDPRVEVARLAESTGADLIVLGIHSAAPTAAKTFAETTAGRIVQSTLKPILVVRNPADEPYQRAVIGVDFSPFSLAAIRQIVEYAPGADLHLVHAYRVPYAGFMGNPSTQESVAYAERLELDTFLRTEMEALESRARNTGKTFGTLQTSVEEGHPEQVIRDACGRVQADIVVLGTHSRASFSRSIWGSVALDILGNPPCDVMIAKPFVGMTG